MRLDVVLWFLVVMIKYSNQASRARGSLEDAEDFGKFLEKTVDAEPENDDDEYLSPNAWENSGKFEGDMVLEERQRKILVDQVVEGISRNGLRDITKRWPQNTVVYDIETEDFGPEYIDGIKRGIEDIEANSCIRFRPRTSDDSDFVKIMGNRRGCFSKVGYVGGEQYINLQPRSPGLGCFRHGTVVHELLHSLGFFHMQSDDKRDDYVSIIWDNIAAGTQQNFRKYSPDVITDFGVPYDYASVLHYSEKAFSKNGLRTIVPKSDGANIGQRTGMSSGDIQKLNLMYGCQSDSNQDSISEAKLNGSEHKQNGKQASLEQRSFTVDKNLRNDPSDESYNDRFYDSPYKPSSKFQQKYKDFFDAPCDEAYPNMDEDSFEKIADDYYKEEPDAYDFSWFWNRK